MIRRPQVTSPRRTFPTNTASQSQISAARHSLRQSHCSDRPHPAPPHTTTSWMSDETYQSCYTNLETLNYRHRFQVIQGQCLKQRYEYSYFSSTILVCLFEIDFLHFPYPTSGHGQLATASGKMQTSRSTTHTISVTPSTASARKPTLWRKSRK